MAQLSKSATFHDFCGSPSSFKHDDYVDDDYELEDELTEEDEERLSSRDHKDPPAAAAYAISTGGATSGAQARAAPKKSKTFANWFNLFVSKRRPQHIMMPTHNRSLMRPSMSLCRCYMVLVSRVPLKWFTRGLL